MAFVEAKAVTRVEGIAEALDQVRRYHREGPELMSLLQLYSLTHLVPVSGERRGERHRGGRRRCLRHYPHWQESAAQEREVRVALLKTLRESSPEKANARKLVGLTEGLLAMLRQARLDREAHHFA